MFTSSKTRNMLTQAKTVMAAAHGVNYSTAPVTLLRPV